VAAVSPRKLAERTAIRGRRLDYHVERVTTGIFLYGSGAGFGLKQVLSGVCRQLIGEAGRRRYRRVAVLLRGNGTLMWSSSVRPTQAPFLVDKNHHWKKIMLL